MENNPVKEFEIKLSRIRKFIKNRDLKGLVLNRVSNFAWVTGGKSNYVALNTDFGASSIFITPKKAYLLANNIEAVRMTEEELPGLPIEPQIFFWFEDSKLKGLPKKIAGSDKIGCDADWQGFMPVEIWPLHFPLTVYEIARYKYLGKLSGRIMTGVCRELKAGQTEYEISGLLARKLLAAGIVPAVMLVAADERIKKFRHPLPTATRVKGCVMIVLCAKKYGLIASLSRLVHFGKTPDDLQKKHQAVCSADAAFIAGTKPGNSINTIFQKAKDVYEKNGYPKEWRLHHQGGLTGYQTRYFRGFAGDERKVMAGQTYAWNPSITGTKSEDTILVGKNCVKILTEDGNWPKISIKCGGRIIRRPAILVR